MLEQLKALAKRSRLVRALVRRLRRALGVPEGIALLPGSDPGVRRGNALWVVDTAMPIAGLGVVIVGWCLDPAGEIQHLEVLGSDGSDLRGSWSRHARGDVINAHPQLARGISEPGYLALVRLSGKLPSQITLSARTVNGVEKKSVPVSVFGNALSAVETVLSIAPLPMSEVRALFDRHLGPAIDALWKARPAERPQGVLHWFGNAPAAPRLSILIPLYGRYDFVRYQLALFANDPAMRSEVELLYVVDDPAIHAQVLNLAEGIQPLFGLPFGVVTSRLNLGYAGANNLGARHARGELLLLLNSDVMPRDAGWTCALMQAFDALPDAGIVGPTLVYEDGAIQHIGMHTEAYGPWDGLPINVHPRKGQPLGELPAEPQAVEGVTGACMLIRRALYEQLGGLDEGYILGDFEDSDLCLRVRRLGLGIHWIPPVVLFHLERQSQNLFTNSSWKARLTLYNCWRHQRVMDQGAAS